MRIQSFLRASLLACALSVLMTAGLSAPASAQISDPQGCPPGQIGWPPDCVALPGPGNGCPDGQIGTPPDCAALPAACPAGQTGTPPNCTTTPATCPAGQTGTPPNCTTTPATCPAGQTGTPPNCTTAPATCPAGQTGTPPACTVSGTATAASNTLAPARLIRRTVDLSRGCSRKLMSLTGGIGAEVVFTKRLTRLRCRLTLRVIPGVTGQRKLHVKRGKRTITLSKPIRL